MSQYIKNYFNSSQTPTKLMFFLHGYNGDTADIESAARFFSQNKQELLILTPESAMISEKNPAKKQWYSLWEFDPEDRRRKQETSLSELIEIYNRFGNSLHNAAKLINTMINEQQQKYGINNQNTIIAGFSQGAMLACYTALSRPDFTGKCFMFSGVVAGADSLEKEQNSTPSTYLFHGKNDLTVNYKTMDYSLGWLEKHHISTRAFRYEDTAHRLTEPALTDALKFI